MEGIIVRKHEQDILAGINLLRLLDRADCLLDRQAHIGLEEWLRGRPAPLLLHFLEHRPGTAQRATLLRGNLCGDGEVLGGPDLAAVVAQVAAHEDEGVWVGRRAGQAAHVADGMAGRVDEIEGSVSEEVEGSEGAYFYGLGVVEVDFSDGAASGDGQQGVLNLDGLKFISSAMMTYLKSVSRSGESCFAG